MSDSKALFNVTSAYKVFDLLDEKSQRVIKMVSSDVSCDEICQNLDMDIDELMSISLNIVKLYRECENCQDFKKLLSKLNFLAA